MKRSKKKYVLIFVFSFLGFTIPYILLSHFFAWKGMPPQTWEEMYEDLPFTIIFFLIFSIFFTLWEYGKSPTNDNDRKET